MALVLQRFGTDRRPSRVQIAALMLLTLFALGPLVAFWVVFTGDSEPTERLLAAPDAPADGLRVTGTVLAVTPTAGELVVRLVPQPSSDLMTEGRLDDPLTLQVNDARGRRTWDFPAGQPPGPVEATVPLTDGSIDQYPFDSYITDLVVLVSVGNGDEPQALPVALDLVSTVTDYSIVATDLTAENGLSPTLAVAELDISRRGTTVVYAVAMMLLMWGLAITGVLLAWTVVISNVEVPMWAFGYFVGVLFALPPLRDSLPGRPPPGVLLDFVAFYWSIGIVGITLLMLIGAWIVRVRRQVRTERVAARAEAGLASADDEARV